MNKAILLLVAGWLTFAASAASAVPSIYFDEATLLGALGPSRTFDFETSSGFPAGPAPIGIVDGVNFDAQTSAVIIPTSGVQSMTGSSGPTSAATVSFTTPTTGFGFFALDLTVDEFIQVVVEFAGQPNLIFEISLGGAADFTPIYFGLVDPADTILSLTFSGSDNLGLARAWLIDDLSVSAIPAPAPLVLVLAFVSLLGLARMRRTAA